MRARRFVVGLVVVLCGSLLGWADGDRARVMLVLDASGSMWGQVDGRAKIEIAREVIHELLGSWDQHGEIGLTVYGHRRKGDCEDIETVVPPGADTTAAIATAVNAVQPKGKTPLSSAVRKAAEVLRYTEERAAVVLISDGEETCDADPCAVGAELALTGVDLTIHVIGFDVAEVEQAGLRCLAENTGGLFLTASTAEELGSALDRTVARVQEPPEAIVEDPGQARLTAPSIVAAGAAFEVAWEGPDSRSDYITLVAPDTPDQQWGSYVYTHKANPVVLRAPDAPGTCEVRYVHHFTRTVLARATVQVTPVTARVVVPSMVAAGAMIEIGWQGPDNQGDFVTIVEQGTADRKWGAYKYTSDGSPLQLRAPDEPGAYEIRYCTGQSYDTLATAPVEVTAVQASLSVQAKVAAGAVVEISWQGPDNQGDFVTIVVQGTADRKWGAYKYTSDGSPLQLRVPDEPGAYEIRYCSGQSYDTLATAPLEVTAVGASLSAPAAVAAGTAFEVSWKGPDSEGDFITIVEHGSAQGKWGPYTYTTNGSPLTLTAPQAAGEYEIRYLTGQSYRNLASVRITVN